MPPGSPDVMIDLSAIMSPKDFFTLFGDEAKVTCKLGQCNEKFEYVCELDILHHLRSSHGDVICYEIFKCPWRLDEHSSTSGGRVDSKATSVCGKICSYGEFSAHLAEAHFPASPFSAGRPSTSNFAELTLRAFPSRGQQSNA